MSSSHHMSVTVNNKLKDKNVTSGYMNRNMNSNTNNNMNMNKNNNPNTPSQQALPDEDIRLTSSTSNSTECCSTHAVYISKTLSEPLSIAGDGDGAMAGSVTDPDPDEAWVLVPIPLDLSGVLAGVGARFSG
ncbi:hypothetical protein N656DRAFT_778856 [Canariomyces notabilis]|uniref:Uncharacterized protein n=1 Tax=Canariomyces notabilis TaxID=2074819 RepID=A0AAN6TDX8_9PEZI|nr:hypothetical protein N656DRAFT_778856 [Canariomyces arenarius]